jgi:splicing factor U2AF subunit
VQFRTPDEATNALTLNGTEFQDVALELKRPKEYIGIDPSLGGGASSNSPNKLFIGGLPLNLNEEQVGELLKSFGELKSFNLVQENVNGEMLSKGFAFCEYHDEAITDMAIQGLHNFQLGDKALVVQRADVGRNTGSNGLPGTTHFLNSRESRIAACPPTELTFSQNHSRRRGVRGQGDRLEVYGDAQHGHAGRAAGRPRIQRYP